jgi:hypothetical protein
VRKFQDKADKLEAENKLKSKVISILFGEFYEKLPSAKELSERLDQADYLYLKQMQGKSYDDLQTLSEVT